MENLEQKYPNKIMLGNKALIDLTNDTATEDKVLEGYTFHKADGTIAVGTYVADEQPVTGAGYYPIGSFNNWVLNPLYKMSTATIEDIAQLDENVAQAISLIDYQNIYIVGGIELGTSNADWNQQFGHNGELCHGNGSLIMKWVYSEDGENIEIGDWIPNPVPGGYGNYVNNLTSDTLWIPPYQEEPDEWGDDWQKNPICVGGAGEYITVLVKHIDNYQPYDIPQYSAALIKVRDIESDWGDIIPVSDIGISNISLIGSMTNWDTDIDFIKESGTLYTLSNYSFMMTQDFYYPSFEIRANHNWDSSIANSPNITYNYIGFPNDDYSAYLSLDGQFNCLKLFEGNISVQLTEDSLEGFQNSTITFTWLQDIAEPTFEINSLDLVGTQNNFTFGETPFTLDSGSASGQGTWVLPNNSFSQGDRFLFAVNGSWTISGGRDWSNFIFSNFPNNNDYSSYLQAPGEPPFEDNTAVLNSFVGTITISVDAEQVKIDRDLSSATITITYEGEN